MKGLKVFNIILFTLICGLETVALYYLASSAIVLIQGDLAGVLVSMIALLPLFIIIFIALFVLTIIITITSKALVKKELETGLSKTKFDKLSTLLSWIFLAVDVIGFIAIFVIANISNK